MHNCLTLPSLIYIRISRAACIDWATEKTRPMLSLQALQQEMMVSLLCADYALQTIHNNFVIFLPLLTTLSFNPHLNLFGRNGLFSVCDWLIEFCEMHQSCFKKQIWTIYLELDANAKSKLFKHTTCHNLSTAYTQVWHDVVQYQRVTFLRQKMSLQNWAMPSLDCDSHRNCVLKICSMRRQYM